MDWVGSRFVNWWELLGHEFTNLLWVGLSWVMFSVMKFLKASVVGEKCKDFLLPFSSLLTVNSQLAIAIMWLMIDVSCLHVCSAVFTC